MNSGRICSTQTRKKGLRVPNGMVGRRWHRGVVRKRLYHAAHTLYFVSTSGTFARHVFLCNYWRRATNLRAKAGRINSIARGQVQVFPCRLEKFNEGI